MRRRYKTVHNRGQSNLCGIY